MDLVTRSTLLSQQTIDDIVVGHLPVIPAPLPADPANAALVLKGVKDVATPDLLSLREAWRVQEDQTNKRYRS